MARWLAAAPPITSAANARHKWLLQNLRSRRNCPRRKTSLCCPPVPLNMSLPAFAAERRRLLHGAPAPDRYLLPTERRAANPPATAAAVDRRDRQTDGWTVEIVCLIFIVLGILILEFYISRIGDQFSAELFSCCSTVDCLHVWPTLHYFAVRIWKWD